jgi:hypothetical protein
VYKQGINVIEQTLDFVWLKICKKHLKAPEDIFVCMAYIPPTDSQYLASLGVDILEQINQGISKFSKMGHVILTGDLNARTGSELDLITGDNDMALPLDFQYIKDKQIPGRNSQDSTVNARGREILELCVSAGLRIVNGRKVGDTLGYHTCHKWNGSSVVDYLIASEALLDFIPTFKVKNFMADVSDHCCITWQIKTGLVQPPVQNEVTLPFPCSYKWNPEAKHAYEESFLSHSVQAEVRNFLKAKFSANEQDISLATNQITNIFQTAAEKSLRKRSSATKRRRPQQPWHDKSLKQQRRDLLYKGSLMTKYPSDPQIRSRYFRALKLYRKNCKKQCRLHKQQLITQLDNLYESHPKAYWELVKKLREDNDSNNSAKISPTAWLQHFQSLGQKENFKMPLKLNTVNEELSTLENSKNFTELDFKITESEIMKGIANLKNGKAAGPDGICNELLKHSTHAMLAPLQKIFNLVLTSGVYPDSWARGFIKPLHKKEDPLIPNNYRGITITSVMGKLFNSILNARIINFLDKQKLMCSEQIGFKAKSRTSDHIFVIKALMDKAKKERKPLYMCFVDFQKAFDSISHPCLLYKLLKMNMNGCVYQLIKDMYRKTILQVNVGKGLTTDFTSDVGVRQGDNLSPTLFNLYINDIPRIFDNTCKPVSLGARSLSCLLYADDLVLLSESADGLKNALNRLSEYCNDWGLTVNPKKTKALVFNDKKGDVKLTIDSTDIESVNEVTYLGTVIDKNGTFQSCLKGLYCKGLKAMFKLRKALSPMPKVETGVHLFNHMIKPILLYGSEIWSYALFGIRNSKNIQAHNIAQRYHSKKPEIESCQLKYCKSLLGLPRNTDNCVAYGELGVYPLYIEAIDRMLKYWHALEKNTSNVLLHDAYACVKVLHQKGANTWLSFANSIRDITGSRNTRAPTLDEIRALKTKMRKLYRQYWETNLQSDTKSRSIHGRKLRTYRKFKTIFGTETYLISCTNPNWRMSLTRFRASAHRLAIEMGRRSRTALENRLCTKCHLNMIEDEWHFLFVCPLYQDVREIMMNLILNKSPQFHQLDNDDQLCWLMSNQDREIITALANYVHTAMNIRFPKPTVQDP